MKISTKQNKSGMGQCAAAEGRDREAKPKFSLFRTFYTWFKYGTIIAVVMGIVLGGVMILGQVGEEIRQEKSMEALFKSSSQVTETVEDLSKLLNSKKSSFLSSKVINLYLQQKPSKNPTELYGQLSGLGHLVDHFLTQRYQHETVTKFPLDMYDKNYIQVVNEPLTSKALRWLKTRIQTVLEKNSIKESDSIKQLKWSRVKKLIDGGKFGEILELIQENAVNWVWEWIGKPSKVIVLLVDESNIVKSTPQIIQKNKKLLKKWIEQQEDNHEVIIVSRYSINTLYDSDKEDTLKSLKVDLRLQHFDSGAVCKFLNEHQSLNENQCQLLRGKFETLNGLYQFVNNKSEDEKQISLKMDLVSKKNEANKVLQKVCEKGQTKYYFYENQQNADKILTRNKKAKKSRLDRELEVLMVKWSELKHAMGLNQLNEIYNTLFSGFEESQERLSLREANSIGLWYDFEQHVLRWKSDEERLEYELRVERRCGEQGDEVDSREGEKEDGEKEDGEKDQGQEEGATTEYYEQQQAIEQQEEELEEEYEENPIHYDHDNDEEEGQTDETPVNEKILDEEEKIEDQIEGTQEINEKSIEAQEEKSTDVQEKEPQANQSEKNEQAQANSEDVETHPDSENTVVEEQEGAVEGQEGVQAKEQEQANTQNSEEKGETQQEQIQPTTQNQEDKQEKQVREDSQQKNPVSEKQEIDQIEQNVQEQQKETINQATEESTETQQAQSTQQSQQHQKQQTDEIQEQTITQQNQTETTDSQEQTLSEQLQNVQQQQGETQTQQSTQNKEQSIVQSETESTTEKEDGNQVEQILDDAQQIEVTS